MERYRNLGCQNVGTRVKTHSISLPLWSGVLSRQITVRLSVQPARCSLVCCWQAHEVCPSRRYGPYRMVHHFWIIGNVVLYSIWNVDHALICYWTSVYRISHSNHCNWCSTLQDCNLQHGDSHPPELNFLQISVHNYGSITVNGREDTVYYTMYIYCTENSQTEALKAIYQRFAAAAAIWGFQYWVLIRAYYC